MEYNFGYNEKEENFPLYYNIIEDNTNYFENDINNIYNNPISEINNHGDETWRRGNISLVTPIDIRERRRDNEEEYDDNFL